MELKHLLFFVASVEMGSLSRSAEVLYTTQPHISKVIQQLENHLGLCLLERKPSGVTITEDGKKVYEYARKVLDNAQKISAIRQENTRQELHISTMPSQGLARLFAGFFEAEPTLSVRFLEGTLEKVLHQLAHRQADLGFIFISGYQQQMLHNMLRHKKLDYTPLASVPQMLFAGPKNPCYHKPAVMWTDLQKLRYVQHEEEGISLTRHIGQMHGHAGFQTLQTAAVVSSDHAMMQLLTHTPLANIGCQLGSQDIAPIHAIPLAGCGDIIEFGYAKRSAASNGYAAKFIAYLEQHL